VTAWVTDAGSLSAHCGAIVQHSFKCTVRFGCALLLRLRSTWLEKYISHNFLTVTRRDASSFALATASFPYPLSALFCGWVMARITNVTQPFPSDYSGIEERCWPCADLNLTHSLINRTLSR